MNRRWLQNKIRTRLRTAVASRLYRDPGPDLAKTILVAGTARSGTTWLADIIDAQLSCRVLFEPFHSGMVEEFAMAPIYPYLRPGEEAPEIHAYAERVLRGQVRHPWIDKEVKRLTPTFRLVKDVRINLFLKWLIDCFPAVSPLLIVRHPCAVVLSRMEAGWKTDQDLAALLSIEPLVSAHLKPHLSRIRKLETTHQKHALIWCLLYLVPFAQLAQQDCRIVFYETLCRSPQVEIPRVFEALGQPCDERVLRASLAPSSTSSPKSAILTGEDKITRWQRVMSRAEIDQVLSVVELLGLSDVYGTDPMPTNVAGFDRWRLDLAANQPPSADSHP